MKRYKLRRIDFWIYLIIAFILGILATLNFSSPSSEARVSGVGTGFIGAVAQSGRASGNPEVVGSNPTCSFFESLSDLADSNPSGVDMHKRRPAPTFTVTAYCQNSCCCGEFADGITASGHIIEPNDCFVAAPPDIPFGTRLSIPGYAGGRMVAVEDRGGKIKGNRLDVFFGGKDGHEEALAWGVREFRCE